MKHITFTSVLLCLAVSATAAEPGTGRTHKVRLNGHTFTLPVGFDIDVAAGPPLVDRPIAADFDEQGRLYVSDSSGSNEKLTIQLDKKPHRIVRLEDTRGNGRFDKGTVFADKMMFPEGVMWLNGSLYVAAPPSIWKLTDTDGDGVADQRVEWFQGKTLTGCGNDLHGPYLGPDGWIYWCKGAFAQQTYERPGKKPLVTRAAHIFRARPDGTGVEPVMTGGMDNPVDVVFTRGGERIFTTTFLQFPGGGKRDGLIHAIYGGVYGKDWEVIQDHIRTGPSVMPVMTHLGAAAPAGLTRYESNVFGSEYQDNLFACLFNMQKVTRHVLIPEGATFKTQDSDFLVSDNKDFHPTDVIEDADGSLLVIDTGGWYKLCCPTSQLVKPDVLGAIYRIRKKGTELHPDPRGIHHSWSKMTVGQLTDYLDDPRPAVRKRAIQALAAKGAEAVQGLEKVVLNPRRTMDEARLNAVWALTRINDATARTAVRKALDDPDETVRQAAVHSISVWRDRAAVPLLIDMLNVNCTKINKEPSMQNCRVAAEALGRMGDRSALWPLARAAVHYLDTDRGLEHSLIYAVTEIGDAKAVEDLLNGDVAWSRQERIALIILDQMGAKLQAADITPLLASTKPLTRQTGWWIASHHPEWGGDLAAVIRKQLSEEVHSPPIRDETIQQLSKLARNAAVQTLLAELVSGAKASIQGQRLALAAMAQAGLKETPAAWTEGLTKLLAANDVDLLPDTIATARALRLSRKGSDPLAAQLLKIGHDNKQPAHVRVPALAAVPGGLEKVDPALLTFLRGQFSEDVPLPRRALAADVLGRARLAPEQLLELTATVRTAAPMEVDRLLEAYAQSTDAKVGLAVLAALNASKSKAALRPEAIKPRLAKYGPEVQKKAAALYAALNVGEAEQRAKLEKLLPLVKTGDVRRGQAVFNSAKTSCTACHAIGYLGGNVGPDLTRIGQIRTERDLLEAIVFPSASFVRSYEPVVVTTRDGKVHNGVIRKDTSDGIVLATGINQEVRLSREEIEEIQPSRVSIMPAGLDQLLTPRELGDLVAFLKACK